MFFCKSKKFIFLRVPRAASTSLSYHLTLNLKFKEEDFYTQFNKIKSYNISNALAFDEHPCLQQFLDCDFLKEDELQDFKIYGVLRNPVERFFSLGLKLFPLASKNEKLKELNLLTYDEIADFLFSCLEKNSYQYATDDISSPFPLMPQTKWLMHRSNPINGLMVYPNFNSLIDHATPNVKFKFEINKSFAFNKNSKLDQELITEIHKWYSSDFDLWEQVTGQRLI